MTNIKHNYDEEAECGRTDSLQSSLIILGHVIPITIRGYVIQITIRGYVIHITIRGYVKTH